MMKVLKTGIIEGLKDLASYDFQRTAWFENNLGLSSSFAEDVAGVFDDYNGMDDAFLANQIVFSIEADAALKELEAACDVIGYDDENSVLLDSPEMKIIREMAKKCLLLIRNSDGSESTVQLINNEIMLLDVPFPDRDNL